MSHAPGTAYVPGVPDAQDVPGVPAAQDVPGVRDAQGAAYAASGSAAEAAAGPHLLPAGCLASLAERLCHDFAGLAGSLAGLVDMAAEGEAEALPEAAIAADALVARLRLLRAAWGPEGGALAPDALAALGTGLAAGTLRVELSEPLAAAEARVALCLAVAAASLARPAAVLRLTRSGAGLAVLADPPLRTLCDEAMGGPAAPSPRAMPLVMARQAAASCGWVCAAGAEGLRAMPG